MEINEDWLDHVSVDFVKVEVITAKCKRCGASWNPKHYGRTPRRCAKCNSPYWNKERLRTGANGAVNKYGFDTWEVNKWYPIPSFLNEKGGIDTARNEARWRSLAQFARRRGLNAHFDPTQPPLSARAMLIK